MTEYPLHGIALYNPNLLSRDEVKRYFVGRQALLDRILSDIQRARPGTCPQHRLILGQRGMGKTTVLRRLAIAIEEDETLSSTWLPLSFPEEQHNVANLASLWLNCLDSVSDYLESQGDRAAADSIDASIDQIGHYDGKAVLRTLIDHTKALSRRLILLIDNIDLIFDRLKAEQWALRDALQANPEIMIIGASARAVEATYQYDAGAKRRCRG